MKKKINYEKVEKERRVIWPYLIILFLVAILIAVGLYAYLYNEKYTKLYKDEINKITEMNELAFKSPNIELEYLNTWSYDEIIDNLIDKSKLVEGTNINIFINDLEFFPEDTLSFDEVGDLKIVVNLTYNYEYTVFESKVKVIENSEEFLLTIKDSILPVLNGVQDKEITVGDKLDVLEGISATDEKEGSLEVHYEGEFDVNKAGTYNLIIYAIDANNNRVEQNMQITVKEKKTTTTKPSTGSTTTKPSTGSTTKPSTDSTTKPSTTPTCDVTNAYLQKRGYKPTQDKDACEKNKQATEIAKKVADEILAQGYTTDLDKVNAAAAKVSEYYQKGVHVEEGYDYRTPYGVFVKGEASCAGCTRALIQVLELMGFTNLTHANENGWTHQWVILEMDGQKGFAEAQLGFAGYGCHPVDESCTE